MKKNLTLVFFIVVTIGILVFLCRDAFGASGDAEVIVKTPDSTLTTAQKTKLANIVIALYPGVALNTVEQFYCRRKYDEDKKEFTNDVACQSKYKIVKTNADAITLDAEGKAGILDAYDSTTVTFVQQAEPVELSVAQKATLSLFVGDAFTPLAVSDIVDFMCKKDGSNVVCAAAYIDQLSPATWKELRKQSPSPILKTLRKVP